MAYTPPGIDTFLAAFPCFAGVSDETYALWLAEAAAVTGPQAGCLDTRTDMATMLLTAHYLTLAGIGAGAEAEMAAQGMSGFKSIRSGSLSLDRGENNSSAGQYGSTSYGQRAWAMIAPCVAGPIVSCTGTVGCGAGFNGYAGALPPWAC